MSFLGASSGYHHVAATIIRTMGGHRRLSSMIGADDFIDTESGVQFKFDGDDKTGNEVSIDLMSGGLYRMTFFHVRGYNFKKIAEFDGVYADQLKSTFADQTGLYL